jgi:cell division protein ZapE
VRGLYLWGGVGRGKTYLVDTFVDALPLERKQRIHFHSFMRAVHAELKELKNQPEPLRIVARRFAEKARVICLDEFFVADITDAMLLDGLLQRAVRQRRHPDHHLQHRAGWACTRTACSAPAFCRPSS